MRFAGINLLNSEIRPTIIPKSVNYFPVYSAELPCSYSLREGVLFNLQHIQIFPKYNTTKSQIQFVCLLDRFQASRLSKFTRRCYGNLTGTLTGYNLCRDYLYCCRPIRNELLC